MAEVYVKREGGKRVSERLSVTQLRSMLGGGVPGGLLTCYATFPPATRFDTQEPGEVVVLFLRQHWIVNVVWILLVLLALSLPAAFPYIPFFNTLPAAFQLVLHLMFYLFVAGFALSHLMSWFFNIYLLTDERVVDIDFVNILYRRVSIAKLDEIQDVNVIASGAFETFFNYGSIFIQTAAEVTQFEFLNIPYPDKVSTIINQMIDQEEQEKIEGRVK